MTAEDDVRRKRLRNSQKRKKHSERKKTKVLI